LGTVHPPYKFNGAAKKHCCSIHQQNVNGMMPQAGC